MGPRSKSVWQLALAATCAAIGLAALIIVMVIPISVASDSTTLSQLESLRQRGDSSGFFGLAIDKAHRLDPPTATKVLVWAYELHSQKPQPKDLMELGKRLESRFTHYEPGFRLLAHIRVNLGLFEAVVAQYEGSVFPKDWLYVEARERTRAEAVPDFVPALEVAAFSGFTTADWYQSLAETLAEPRFYFFAAAYWAESAHLAKALEIWGRGLAAGPATSEAASGWLDLNAGALVKPDRSLLAAIQSADLHNPRLAAAQAEQAIGEGRFDEGFQAWAALAKQSAAKTDTAWIFQNLAALTEIGADHGVSPEALTAARAEIARFQVRVPFPVPYRDRGYDELVANFWTAVPNSPDRPEVWRTLAWLLATKRDVDPYRELMAKVSGWRDPWVVFYKGMLSALDKDWGQAADYFEEAGNSGLPEGAENAAFLYRAAGETARADRLHQQALRTLRLFYPPNWLALNGLTKE